MSVRKIVGMLAVGSVALLGHVSEATAGKSAAKVGTKLHSTEVLASASARLKGVAKDAYEASGEFVSKPIISARPGELSVANKVAPVANEFGGAKALVKAPSVTPRGATLIKENGDAKFYRVNNKVLSSLYNNADFQLDTASIHEAIIEVPVRQAGETENFSKLLSKCKLKMVFEPEWTKAEDGTRVKLQYSKIFSDEDVVQTARKDIYNTDGSHESEYTCVTTYKDESGEAVIGTLMVDRYYTNGRFWRTDCFLKDYTNDTQKPVDLSEFLKYRRLILNRVGALGDMEVAEINRVQPQTTVAPSYYYNSTATQWQMNNAASQQTMDRQFELNNIRMQQENAAVQQNIRNNVNNANHTDPAKYGNGL